MTLAEARKVIGKNSMQLTDSQLQKEIETAEFLANLFLDIYLNNKGDQESSYPKPRHHL